MVLYFGLTKWSQPLNLKDCLTIREGIGKYVNDYPSHVFEIAFLDEDTLARFKSDFRLVAEYFVQSRRIKEGSIHGYSLTMKELVHIKEVVELMSVLTGDHSFEDSYNNTFRREGGTSMWTLVDYIREQAEEKYEAERKRIDQSHENLILLYKGQGRTKEDTLLALQQVFSLSGEKAEELFAEYW